MNNTTDDRSNNNNNNNNPLPSAWGNTSEEEGGPSLIEYRSRVARIQQMPCNETCADCDASHPQWASLLLLKGGEEQQLEEGT